MHPDRPPPLAEDEQMATVPDQKDPGIGANIHEMRRAMTNGLRNSLKHIYQIEEQIRLTGEQWLGEYPEKNVYQMHSQGWDIPNIRLRCGAIIASTCPALDPAKTGILPDTATLPFAIHSKTNWSFHMPLATLGLKLVVAICRLAQFRTIRTTKGALRAMSGVIGPEPG